MAQLGDVLGGRYRLVELLGEGGMATIFRATDAQLGRDVAVKVLRPEYGSDPDFVARFRQEAQAAASLSHPGIVGVYDFGTSDGGPVHRHGGRGRRGPVHAPPAGTAPCPPARPPGWSPRWPVPSTRLMPAASSIATSSPATSC